MFPDAHVIDDSAAIVTVQTNLDLSEVIYIATDSAGNIASCSISVNVIDNTKTNIGVSRRFHGKC